MTLVHQLTESYWWAWKAFLNVSLPLFLLLWLTDLTGIASIDLTLLGPQYYLELSHSDLLS